MPRYRICKTFTVESGHMLSKHPERCRFPHGHTRTVEVVISGDELDQNDMLVDFKALSMSIGSYINRYDHALAINSEDPLLAELLKLQPESAIIFEQTDPTTEAIAKDVFDRASQVLAEGWEGLSPSGATYRLVPGKAKLERVRVWETPSSWAEYGD